MDCRPTFDAGRHMQCRQSVDPWLVINYPTVDTFCALTVTISRQSVMPASSLAIATAAYCYIQFNNVNIRDVLQHC